MDLEHIAALETVAKSIGYLATIGGFLLFLCKVWVKIKGIADGQKCLLRTDIMTIYYHHCEEDEPTLREYERKQLDALVEAYVVLKGNSFVSDIYEQMRHWHVSS